MSILDKATLLVTPNAYKANKLYSIIPTNGDGDFAFTRAGNATRTNENGFIEDVPYNLFQFSEEFSNAYWGKTSGTITPDAITAPDGTLTADLFTKTVALNTVSNINRASTTFYLGVVTISLYVKQNVGNTVGIRLASNVQFEYRFSDSSIILPTDPSVLLARGAEPVGNGWIRLYLTANVTGAVNPFILNMYSAALNDSVYVWGAQINKGHLKPYVRTSDRTNTPRIDYTLGGNCPVVETEVQRTNMVTYSEDMTQSAVYGFTNTIISSNQMVAPDENETADKVIPNSTNDKHKISIVHGLGTIITTISVFAKKGELDRFKLGLTSDTNLGVVFNLTDGTTTAPETGGSTTGKIIPYGDGWYRCCITGQLAGSTCDTLILGELGNETYSGDGSKGLYLWGWQIERSANPVHNCFYVTSYIPTYDGNIQTRAGELLNITNLVNKGILGATEGTLYIHIVDNFIAKKNANTPTERAFTLAPTTAFSTAGVISIRRLSNSSNPGLRTEVTYTNTSTSTIKACDTTSTEVKLAIKFKISTIDGYLRVFQNGNPVTSNLDFRNGTPITFFGGIDPGTLNFKSLALFNTQLSDAECQALTT
jgi:hypothetical protein